MDESEVNRIYNIILHKLIEPIVSDQVTYGNQLSVVGKEIFGSRFVGVFSSDRIPKMKLHEMCILNLDNSNEPGSHWVAAIKQRKDILLYDSFGRSHTKILPSIGTSGNGLVVEPDADSEQGSTEYNCGARSIAFLLFFYIYGFESAMLL